MTSRPEALHVNMAFSCFTNSLLGSLIVGLAIARLGGRPRALAVAAVVGLLLCASALLRRKALWDGAWLRRPALHALALPRRPAGLLAPLALALAGIALGYLAVHSFMLFGVLAGLLGLVPWSKVAVCRAHFIACNLLLAVPAIVIIARSGADPLSLLIVGWMAWAIAVSYQLLTIGKHLDFAGDSAGSQAFS